MGYQSLGWWPSAATNATSNVLYYPTNLTGYAAYPSLPSVVAPQAEYALDRDAKLTPVEWLRRQVDDVCALATA